MCIRDSFCLCTDDKHIDDIVQNGSINSSIVTCIKEGLRPETAIQMATLNPSVLYKLNNKGAIAPGYVADFIILDDLDLSLIHIFFITFLWYKCI